MHNILCLRPRLEGASVVQKVCLVIYPGIFPGGVCPGFSLRVVLGEFVCGWSGGGIHTYIHTCGVTVAPARFDIPQSAMRSAPIVFASCE